MGYSHYLCRPSVLAEAAFSAWVADVRRLIPALPPTVIVHPERTPAGRRPYQLRLAGPEGTGIPILTDDVVACNGAVPNDGDPFVVPRVYTPEVREEPDAARRYFTCCKTGALPYDLLVTAALLRLQHRFPEEVVVSSDGGPPSWEEARRLCSGLFWSAEPPREVARRPW